MKLAWYIGSDDNEDGSTGELYLWSADEMLVYELRQIEGDQWQAFNLVEGLEFKELRYTGTLFYCMAQINEYSYQAWRERQ
jgi:hypothetical protein